MSNGLLPGCTYTLKLGPSWDHIPTELVHAVQYDFKPASIDPSQTGQMKLDDNNGVSIILPHKDTDESSEFKGSKQPSAKECFLVVDNKTNTVFLEKVSNTIRVKKYRTSKKPMQRNVLRREEDRASPVPTSVQNQTKGRDSPVPAAPAAPVFAPIKVVQEDTRSRSPLLPPKPEPITHVIPEPRTFVSEPRTVIPEPRTLIPEPRTLNPEPKSQPNAKRVKTELELKASGNLSSESESASDSDSNSSDESSSSDTEKFTTVKSQQALNLAGSSAMITPLGEPPIKEETSGSGLMDMLSQDLDLTDSDDDFD